MKKYEKESLVKNFLVFFSLLSTLLVLLFVELYHTQLHEYKQDIYKTMKICSYTMDCPQFEYDFIEKDQSNLNTLEDEEGLHNYFPIPKSEKFYMKISYAKSKYMYNIQKHKNVLWVKFILALFLLAFVALFFTFYTLKPIRKALQINDEFIKDILHDFNTPITSMVLNIKMFTEEKGEDPYIKRVSQGMNNILFLQNNLQCFLENLPSQNTLVDIALLVEERQKMIKNNYPKLKYIYEKNAKLVRFTNKDILTRIFDNILSNASKYNKSKGKVTVTVTSSTVIIKDTGKGIKNIQKAMQRYYKEQDRGIGLGLHIVQKLVDELNIEMKITSKVGVGTTFTLDFKHLKKA